MSWFDLAATTLANEHVLVRPLAAADHDGLRDIALDPFIWRYFVSMVTSDDDFEAYFAANRLDHAERRRVVFVVVDRDTGAIAGTTSYGNLSEPDLRLEIGWSWLGSRYRGRGVNRWVKYLLLEHAFERLGAERVEFKTDRLNEPARHGLRNIGAVEEGILRSFNPMPGGRRRDAVFYSVIRQDWAAVKHELATRPKARTATPDPAPEPVP